MAIGIIEGAKLGGLNIPRDVSIIGYDDLPICLYSTPKITTIHQPITKKAELATNLLFEQIMNKSCKKETIILDVKLIERQSIIKI